MAFASPGQPYDAAHFRILDANGSAVTSGESGTISLIGPDSTTALVTGRALAHKGDGYYGPATAWEGSFLTARGTYRWVTSAITGTVALAAQSGTFVVGDNDWWSLRELYTSVRFDLDDGFLGTTTAGGSTLSLTDSRFAWGSTNRWLSSEIFLFEPQSIADANPVRVTVFASGAGTFTFVPAITSTVTGLDFILGNIEGQGWRHERVMDALRTAFRRARPLVDVTDQVSLSAVGGQYEYSLPAGWSEFGAVEYQPDAGYPTAWRSLPPHYAREVGQRGKFSLSLIPAASNAFRVTGRAVASWPGTMAGLVQLDGATLRDDAVYELLMQRSEPEHRQRAEMMRPAVLRARAGAALVRL